MHYTVIMWNIQRSRGSESIREIEKERVRVVKELWKKAFRMKKIWIDMVHQPTGREWTHCTHTHTHRTWIWCVKRISIVINLSITRKSSFELSNRFICCIQAIFLSLQFICWVYRYAYVSYTRVSYLILFSFHCYCF